MDPSPLTTGSGTNFVAFFFNDTATTEIYALSLHDALPIFTATLSPAAVLSNYIITNAGGSFTINARPATYRKNTHLNSNRPLNSNPLFCLRKKNFRRAHQKQTSDSPVAGQDTSVSPYQTPL